MHLAMRDYIDAADGIVCTYPQATKDELFELWGGSMIGGHRDPSRRRASSLPHGPGWDLGRPCLRTSATGNCTGLPDPGAGLRSVRGTNLGVGAGGCRRKDLLPEEKLLIDDLRSLMT